MVSEDSAVRGMCGKEICEILFEVSDLYFLYSPEGPDRVKEVVSIYNIGRKNGKTECHRLTGESLILSLYCKSGRIMNCQLRHIPYSGRKSKHFLRISEITFRRKYLLRPFLSLTRSAPFLYLPDAVFTFLS